MGIPIDGGQWYVGSLQTRFIFFLLRVKKYFDLIENTSAEKNV